MPQHWQSCVPSGSIEREIPSRLTVVDSALFGPTIKVVFGLFIWVSVLRAPFKLLQKCLWWCKNHIPFILIVLVTIVFPACMSANHVCTVLEEARRELEMQGVELQMGVSGHVGAVNWTGAPWQSCQSFWLPSHLCRPWWVLFWLFVRFNYRRALWHEP